MGEYELLFVVPFKFVLGIIWELIKNIDTGEILLGATILHCYLAWKNIKTDDFYYHCIQTCIYGGILGALLCLTS